MPVQAGLVAFSSACFEFADEAPEEAQHGSLANLPKIFFRHVIETMGGGAYHNTEVLYKG